MQWQEKIKLEFSYGFYISNTNCIEKIILAQVLSQSQRNEK
jgi:hypothetical protein